MFLFKKPENFSELRALRIALTRIQWGCLFLFSIGCFVSISLAQISAFVGFATWVGELMATRKWKYIQTPLFSPFIFFAAASVLSVIFSVDWHVSIETLKKLLEILIFFWVLNVLKNLRPKYLFEKLALLSRKINFKTFRRMRLANGEILVLFFAGIGALVALYCFYLASQQGIRLPHRVIGTFKNPISWGVILMMLSLLAGAYLIYPPRKGRTIPGVLFLILVSCLVITLAREAWVGFMVSLAGMLFFRKPVLAILTPLLFVLILILLPVTIQDRLMDMTDVTQQTLKLRLQMWKGGWEIFKDYPVLGCGFNCTPLVADNYRGYELFFRFWSGGLHNNYIQIAVEMGLVGLIAWMSIWVVFFQKAVLRLRTIGKESSDKWIIHGSMWAVVAFLVACVFESHFYDTEVAMIFFTILALPFSIKIKEKKSRS